MGTQLIIRTEAETGKRLAGYIYRVNADGSDLVNLSKQSDSRYAAMPAWSADGTEIVYTATKPGDAVPSLYVMGRDGSNPRQVADLNFEAQYPSWSVDGRIAFAGGVSGGSTSSRCTRRHRTRSLDRGPGRRQLAHLLAGWNQDRILFQPRRDGWNLGNERRWNRSAPDRGGR
jgi:hypothetical protein